VKSGAIILIDFPFTIPSQSKVRPAVVLTETSDKFKDLLVCAISSVVPEKPSEKEIIIRQDDSYFAKTGLRVDSVIKVDRITTLRSSNVITTIGQCSPALWKKVSEKFKGLVD
jgi:mRNA interferase MazF